MKGSIVTGLMRWVVSLAMVAILGLVSMGPALAQEAKVRQGIFGTVTAKGESSLTVQNAQGARVEILVNAATLFQVPGEAQASFDTVKIGSRVALLAEGQAGQQQTALRVMLVPGESRREHRVLVVTDVSGRNIVAEDAQGNKIEVELDHDISADIKGQLVTFIGEKSIQSNRFKSNAEVKIADVVKRLENHAKKLDAEAKAEANAEAKAKKERDTADLRARLEANMQRHLDLFAEVIAKAPEQAKAALQAALEMSLKGHKAALEALGESQARVEDKLRLRTAHGSVESINAQAAEIVIKTERDTQLTLKMTQDTQIRVGDNAGTAADIVVGALVQARFNSDTMVAVEIRVKTEAEAKGTIQSVDAATGGLVLKLSSGATLTLKLTSNTRIEVNDKKVAASDLNAAAAVEVKYDLRTMEALEVEAETMAKAKGDIKAIDATAKTVTVTTTEGTEVTVKIADDTRVNIQGLLFGLLGLSAGMEVEVRYDLVTGIASELKAKTETEGRSGRDEEEKGKKAEAEVKVSGTAGSVNAAQGEVTISLDGGGTITLKTQANTEIKIDGRQGTLADVKVGDRVQAKFNSDTRLASELEVRTKAEGKAATATSASGTLKAVDVAARTVTVTTQSGDLVLKVVGQSAIIVKGSVAALAGLLMNVGAAVNVRYNAEANTLIVLEIKS